MSASDNTHDMFDTSDEWLRRPDVWTGLVLGAWTATRSFGPSLMPRTTAHQAMVSGASAALGFAVGNATYGIVGEGLTLDEQVGVFAATSGLGLAGRVVLAERDGEPLERATLRSMADGLTAGSAAGLGVALVRRSRRPARTAGLIGAIGLVAGAVSVTRDLRDQLARREDPDPPPPRPLPAVAQSATVAVGLAALVKGYRRSGRAAATMLRRRFALSPDVSAYLGRAGATLVWGAVVAAFYDTFVRGMELYDRVLDPGYDQPPDGPERSGSAGSRVEFARTGRQGRRFLLDVPSADEITEVMGERPRARPVRIFVGFDSGRTREQRVAVALAELERTGAYDRSLLVVGSPAGTGVTNPLAFQTADLLTLGDCAGVAVQYERLPSLLCLQKATEGGRTHRDLLEGIAAALRDRPPDRRPRVVVYGESLGAWAGQDAFSVGGGGVGEVAALDDLGVERALWVGTPAYSGWMQAALAAQGCRRDDRVVAVHSGAELARLDPQVRRKLRVVLLTHGDDPVGRLRLELLVARPHWLRGDRPPGVSPRQRYTPFVTALHTIVDTANATNPVPGVFRGTGHDYRLDIPAAARVAYDLPDPGATRWGAVMSYLQAHEAARAEAFRLPGTEPGRDTSPERDAPETAKPGRRKPGR